ncbi:hypothetical protein NZ698_12270 [Chryseobacterium sp. PBS4-4]|uniref:DUF5723 domain-containing protein n=1 Tax=Chryseobacterium edaphi TaxID=2976532 RepID=A0ABT2W6Y5_9FLAO|nr:hypothetical protein [Chryseobacterium edaphi]MCU7617976.1 hypothetical protein [Chryseobacterium edaphi]
MKTKLFLVIAFLSGGILFGQDSLKVNQQKRRLISTTPLNPQVEKVNGLAVGLGFDSKYLAKDQNTVKLQTVNGLNLELNPLGLLFCMFYDPSKSANVEYVQVNGLNISLSGYLRGVSHNGVSVSLYNYGHTMNGLMGSLLHFDTEKSKGVFVTGLFFSSNELKGLSISAFNNAEILKGVQLGFVNRNTEGKGLQIGLVNKSKKMKGLQIGFWNRNGKRTLPFINFRS